MFSQGNLGSTSFSSGTTTTTVNPMKDFEVASPPEDSISALAFSPETIPSNLLVAGSWDNCVSGHKVRILLINIEIISCFFDAYFFQVRCWEVEHTGKTIPKSMQNVGAPVLDVAWFDVRLPQHSIIMNPTDHTSSQ